MACIISLIDPTKNKAVKSITLDGNYKDAENKVKQNNENITKMKPNKKGFFWKVTHINV